MSKFEKWEEFEKSLNITPEQEKEIKIEMEIIQATINARKNNKLSQEELSKKVGLKQSALARVEKGLHSPSISTLIKILTPLGYTLKVVPMNNHKVVSNPNRRKIKKDKK